MSGVIVNSQSGGKHIAVNQYMANDAGVDGVVEEIVHYPNGVVIAKVVNAHTKMVKFITLRGEFVGEAL